jgi:protein-disulfide isomerase
MKIQKLLSALALFLSLFASGLSLFAQDAPEALRPPKGAQTALVVFEDLQCPQCGRVAPLLEQASRT